LSTPRVADPTSNEFAEGEGPRRRMLPDDARRKNAQVSTGPQTQTGKRRSRWNARTHGLLSKEVVIRKGDAKENAAEYRALLELLLDEQQPVGMLESMLVERIAVCYWRLRRVLRAEVGEIRKTADSAIEQEVADQLEDAQSRVAMLPLAAATYGTDVVLRRLQRNSFGLTYLMEVLDDVRAAVEVDGKLSDESSQRLMKTFGSAETGLWYWCFLFTHRIDLQDPDDAGQGLTPDIFKGMILHLLDEHRGHLATLKESREESEELSLDARMARLVLPDARTADKLLRYETAIERQMYRAMNQLERLQRQRLGDIVPPPLSIELNVDH
jgi:hypothetical protein